jgi:tRNA (guanine-N7-)-methyltransferase
VAGGAEAAAPRRKVFGRRHGNKLRASQLRLMGELMPQLRVPGVSPAENPGRTPLLPLWADGRPVWLEIGFGAGEHLVHQALAHPEVGLVGCEPFVNGVAMALGRIEAAGVGNVRIHDGDARDLIELLPAASLARVFLLYPDPWPKTRHRGRRFVSVENLGLLRRAMAPGAELRLATDIADYAEQARAAVAAAPGFEVVRDSGDPWPDWPGTRYEAKALRAGRWPRYLTIVRG